MAGERLDSVKLINIGLEGGSAVTELSDQLLVLRFAFGRLEAAIKRAAAPLTSVFVSGLTKAVLGAARLIDAIGQVIGAVMGVQAVTAKAEKTTKKSGSAAKRTLAGFDQINRLGSSGGGGDVVSTLVPANAVKELSPRLQAIVDAIKAALAPLQQIDLFPLRWQLARLGEAFDALGSVAAQALGGLWHQVFVPVASWLTEHFVPGVLNAVTGAVQALTAVLKPLGEGFSGIWDVLQQLGAFIGSVVMVVLSQLRSAFDTLAKTFTEKSGAIQTILGNIAAAFQGLWSIAAPILTALVGQWVETFDTLRQHAGKIVGFVIDALAGITEFLAGVFTGDWDRAWKGITGVLKAAVNGVIGLLNTILAALTGALNGVIGAINSIHITVPDWVPGLGGKSYCFDLKKVTPPKIPYLAQGAVLPANRPFLAMVGDQKHGTNVEAPLSVIQQAVANAMNQLLAEGFDATVEELRQLRQTVGCIQVGDAVIGRAAQRYNSRMAVVRGGQL